MALLVLDEVAAELRPAIANNDTAAIIAMTTSNSTNEKANFFRANNGEFLMEFLIIGEGWEIGCIYRVFTLCSLRPVQLIG